MAAIDKIYVTGKQLLLLKEWYELMKGIFRGLAFGIIYISIVNEPGIFMLFLIGFSAGIGWAERT